MRDREASGGVASSGSCVWRPSSRVDLLPVNQKPARMMMTMMMMMMMMIAHGDGDDQCD